MNATITLATDTASREQLAGTSPFLILVLPTVVMAMRGATGPALCAVAFSTVAAVSLFIRPANELWWLHPAEQPRLLLFLAVNAAIVAVGSARRAEREQWLQAEQLRVVQVTMRTVQHIVNNSLNQLQMVRLDAEGHLFDGVRHRQADRRLDFRGQRAWPWQHLQDLGPRG